MIELANGKSITEQEYIEILETKLKETEKELTEVIGLLKKIKGGK